MTRFQKGIQLAHFICSIAYYQTHTNHKYYIVLKKADEESCKIIREAIWLHEDLKAMNA